MAEDAEQARLSDFVLAILRAPTWVGPIASFIDGHCSIFEDGEENKLEYTLVHKAFTALVDELLAAHLAELSVSTEDFLAFCQRGLAGGDELHRCIVEELISVDDFLVFKAMMVSRNAQLQREAFAAERHAEEAQQLELVRLEAERLEMERRCLEAELQLMVALSAQLEQRLQLTQALNDLMEAVASMEAGAPAVPPPTPAVKSTTVKLSALRDEEEAETVVAKPVTQPIKTGPSEEERAARAEHLQRQREVLVAKKKAQREAELRAFEEKAGASAATKAAERALGRQEAGRQLAAELSGAQEAKAPVLPDEEAKAVEVRRMIAKQLKQALKGA